jgi:inosine-uridine nucleoside N-ribohydrolase
MSDRTVLTRRDAIYRIAAASVGLALGGLIDPAVASAQGRKRRVKPIPVILDTDIGDDIDDTWALLMLLKSPQFDLRLVTTTNGKSEYRAKIAARFLQQAGRSDVPVGLGTGGRDGVGGQADWVKDYRLSDYPGKVHEDGAQALIDTVNALAKQGTPPTIIGIGPLTTMGEVLTREPNIATKASFSGMLGSVRKGYEGNPTPCVEWNMTYVFGAQKVFTAPWRHMAITPLDTCGLVRLRGELFQNLADSADPMVQALLENYRMWANKASVSELKESSVLYDTVAVYLADPGPKPLLALEDLKIRVTDKGMTVIDPAGAPITVAADWKDLPAYERHLVDVLLGPLVKARR